LNNVTERIRAGEAIRESENQLRILSAQLLTAQENERKRVSRELHDGLQQTLTAIKFKVEAFLLGVNKTRLKEKAKTLEPIISMIQESERDRRTSDLRPHAGPGDPGFLTRFSRVFAYPDIRSKKLPG
jgi:signal transduction histidine kinase